MSSKTVTVTEFEYDDEGRIARQTVTETYEADDVEGQALADIAGEPDDNCGVVPVVIPPAE